MRNLLRVLPVLVATGLGAYAIGGSEAAAQAASPKVNACGCYRDAAGACFCGKKGKCDCPGDCEPKGCEEKRSREIEKEVEAEVKRAKEVDKKQRDEETERRRKEEATADEAEGMEPGSSASEGQTGDSSDEHADTSAKGKKAKKSKRAKETKESKKSNSDLN
jgi:hypothetical protein